jgi:hypothetical protein
VGVFFLEFFCAGIVSCLSAETMVGANVGGLKIRGSPNTRFQNGHEKACKNEGTRNRRKSVLISKVVNPFTRALESPFIGRRRDFYIPILPSNLGNIPSVNMYMNVFYIP